jgi:hypothetical protein
MKEMTHPDTTFLNQQTAASTIRLCTGEVMHKRLRPAKNAFRYGVFFIRVSVRALTNTTTIETIKSGSRFFFT